MSGVKKCKLSNVILFFYKKFYQFSFFFFCILFERKTIYLLSKRVLFIVYVLNQAFYLFTCLNLFIY